MIPTRRRAALIVPISVSRWESTKPRKLGGQPSLACPPHLWLHLQRYITLIKKMFRLDESSQVFLTESGTAFTRSSGINHCLKDSYSRSGVQKKYPQAFSATATRRLITTECRSQDPSSAALIAAQLCHSVAVADKAYAMKSRLALSAGAVHLVEKSISAAAEAVEPSSSKDQSTLSQGMRRVGKSKMFRGRGWVWKLGM